MQSKYEVDISELVRARREIKRWQKDNVDAFNVVNQRMQKTGKSTALMFDNMGRAMNTTGKSTNRLGMQMQQAGYQVGDFAVQIQSGTNAMVALGQQGSQLLGIFGAKGAIAGAALAIGTALVMPLMRAKEGAKEAEDALKKLNETAMSMRGERLSLTGQFDERKAKAAEKHQATIDQISLLEAENAVYAERYGKAKAGTIYANNLLIAELEEQLEVESKAYRIAIRRLDAEEKKLKDAKATAQADKDAVKLAEQLKEQILLIKQEKFAALNFDKDTIGYQEQQKNIAYGIYERELERLNIQGKQKEDLLAGYQHLLDQEQALERINRLNETRMAAEAFIASRDPRFADETALMGMPVTASKQSGPKKTKTPKTGKTPAQQLDEYMKGLERTVKLEKKQVGVSEDVARSLELEEEYKKRGLKVDEERIEKLVRQEAVLRRATQAEERRQDQIDTFSGHIENAFMAAVDGSQSVEDAFKTMMRNIIADIYQQMVAKQAASFITSMIFGAANGAVMSRGNVTPFASGGVVNGPTLFPMSNGIGLMGEAGPEAIMPLKRGKDGKLGVEGGGTTIVQNINVSTGVQQTVRTEIKSLMPQIAESAKAAVVDAKRRGGSYGRVFN